jgi:2-polyprenyl-6-methoxyphenol hydroxylase-like FAD-dependent oxidoreductase
MTGMGDRVEKVEVRCCIAGGGPAGMMLGLLLARAGVSVIVLEKHADFLRDFRGDTMHPSTLELMYELGILEQLLNRPHQELEELGAQIEDFFVPLADFRYLPTHCKFVGLMPQWEFLNFLAEQGKWYPAFNLRMQAEACELIESDGRVTGVLVKMPGEMLEVHAELTVAADGRDSVIRTKARLDVMDLGAPIDVLWMRLGKKAGDPTQTLGRFRRGQILVMLDRGDYWQCAKVIHKGELEALRQRGLEGFREDLAKVAPFLEGRLDELKSWDDIKLLSVRVDRLRMWWRSGLLCIGDSAHAMSPIGGVGINLAIQDGVAAANLLTEPLLRGRISDKDLSNVQRRREIPARLTQKFQVFAQERLLRPALADTKKVENLPLLFRMLQRYPVLRRIPARMVGMGIRPEHVRTREAPAGAVR